MKTNSRTMVAYINRQGTYWCAVLLGMAKSLLLRASEHLLFLKALHILGLKNRRADPMSRSK